MDSKDGGKNSKLIIGGVDDGLYNGRINYHKVVDKYI